MKIKAVSFLIVLTIVSSLFAVVPRTMSYQGKLTDASGVATVGPVNITFQIYSVATGGTALWSESHSSVAINNGLFDVVLGSTVPLNLAFNAQYWVELTVNGEIMSPRSPLTSAPYALRTAVADSLAGGVAGDNWGTQVVQHDATLTGNGTGVSPLSTVLGNSIEGSEITDGTVTNDDLSDATQFVDVKTLGTTRFYVTDGNRQLNFTGNVSHPGGNTIQIDGDGVGVNSINSQYGPSVNLTAGSGITITTPSTNTIQISSSAGSGNWTQSGTYLYPNSMGWSVGIGTTTPSYLLHVNGSARVNSLNVNGAYALPITAGSPGQFLSYNGTWATPSGGTNYWTDAGSYLYPNDNAYARVYDNGASNAYGIYLKRGSGEVTSTANPIYGIFSDMYYSTTTDGTMMASIYGVVDATSSGATAWGVGVYGKAIYTDDYGVYGYNTYGTGVYGYHGDSGTDFPGVEGFHDGNDTRGRLGTQYYGVHGIQGSGTRAGYFSGDLQATGRIYDSSSDAGSFGQVLSSTGSGTDWITVSTGANYWTDAGSYLYPTSGEHVYSGGYFYTPSGYGVVHHGTTGLGGQAVGWHPNSSYSTTPGVWIENTYGEGGGFFANDDMAAIWSPGDGGWILKIFDEDYLPSATTPHIGFDYDGNIAPGTDNTKSVGRADLRFNNGHFANLTLGGVTISSWPGGGGSSYWTQTGSYLYPNTTSWFTGLGTTSPAYRLHVNESGSATAIYAYKATGSTDVAAVDGRSSTRNIGKLGGENNTGDPIGTAYNYGVYGYVEDTGWGGHAGVFRNSNGNWVILGGGYAGGYSGYAGYFYGNVHITGNLTVGGSYPGGAGGSPGGSDTYIQYNSSGTFGGEAAFAWDYSNDWLNIGSPARTGNSINVYRSDGKAIRILGSGSFNSGGRLNFGDADYVYIEEPVDDNMRIYASSGLTIYTGYSTGYGIAGQVLTSGGPDGSVYWSSGGGGLSGSGSTNYLPKWTGSTSLGNSRIIDNGTNVMVGVSSSSNTFHVEGSIASPDAIGYFKNNYTSASDGRAVYGYSKPQDYWGIGGYFEGGWWGVTGMVYPTGGSIYTGTRGVVSGGSGTTYGAYGSAYGSGYNYGVYGSGSGGTYYGVYYSGNLAGSGSKSCIVKTETGPRLMYCQESPGNWFEDFGSAKVADGGCEVVLNPIFLQTVTIDESNPLKVFIQPSNTGMTYSIEKTKRGFIITNAKIDGDVADAVDFDFRVVAKRAGYEDRYLDLEPAAYTDMLLYPTIDDVPEEHRARWLQAKEELQGRKQNQTDENQGHSQLIKTDRPIKK